MAANGITRQQTTSPTQPTATNDAKNFGDEMARAKSVTVKPGDTLWGIAESKGDSLASVEHANPQISNPNLIFPGEKVVLPQTQQARGKNPPASGKGSDPAGKDPEKTSSTPANKANSTPADNASGSPEDPEDAKNGTTAAKDLLDSRNTFFHNPALYKEDPGYSPERAKSESLAATLYDYQSRGDAADVAKLMNALGPKEAAQLLTSAGALSGQQVNDQGKSFTVDNVLDKALNTSGVSLGSGTQPGTLAANLVKDGTQSGNGAMSVAGILDGLGTGTQATALKSEFLKEIAVNGKALGANSPDRSNYAHAAITVINTDQASLLPAGSSLLGTYQQLAQNASPHDGVFGQSDGVPDPDRRYLMAQKRQIESELYGGKSNGQPPTGAVNRDTQYYINQYLSGKTSPGQTHAQLLANLMSVLGPADSYAALASLGTDRAQQLGIGNSLRTLTANGQFTASDAEVLAQAQAIAPSSQNIQWMAGFINTLPNNQNGIAVKTGYAQGSVAGAQQLGREISSGKLSGTALGEATYSQNALADSAVQLSGSLPDQAKVQLFDQLHAGAVALGTGKAQQQQRDVLNAYAADVLGSLGDKSEIATTLRAFGGVGADGAIAPGSGLDNFLQSALSGQADFGIGDWTSNAMTPNGQVPRGVTSLLNGLSGSGDTKLEAGTLDRVLQWSIVPEHAGQASALAAQDTADSARLTTATGYRNALTNLFDKSFNQFVALNPEDSRGPLTRRLQPQTVEDLQALSAIAMGPPYDGKASGNFAHVFGAHAAQFAAYAAGQGKNPQLDNLLADPGGDARHSAAVIFGQLVGSFDAGLNWSQSSSLADAHNIPTAAERNLHDATLVTDFLNGVGSGLALSDPLNPAGNLFKLAGAVGNILQATVFSPDAARSQAQEVQKVEQQMEHANLKPTQVVQELYQAWYASISELPGSEGDRLTDGVDDGSSFAGAPTVEIPGFYRDYNPLGYYHSQTGHDAPTS